MYYYSYRAFYFFISVRLVNLNAKIVKIERNAKQIAILFSFIFFTVVGGFIANISTIPSVSPLGLPSFSLACGWRFCRQHLHRSQRFSAGPPFFLSRLWLAVSPPTSAPPSPPKR